jgi:uncharacterized protein (DUF2236 family)/Ca2+-binding EF-hand superfamily protein
LLRELSGELGWGLAVVRGAVLQAALPQIAAALTDQSTFVTHPWRRLHNTVDSVRRLLDESAEVRDREVSRLNRLHARITGTGPDGTGYSGMDPEGRAWVIASLFESTVAMRRYSGRALDWSAQEQLYEEFRTMLAAFGDDPSVLPERLTGFWPYYQRMLTERLEHTAAVDAVLYRLLDAIPAPPLLRDQRTAWAAVRSIAGPVAARVTIASLPPTFRERVKIEAPILSDALMVGAYRGSGLAARALPILANPWTLAELIDPEDGQHSSALFGALLRGASAVTSVIREGRGQSAASGPARDRAPWPAQRFFTHVLDQTGDGTVSWPDLASLAREVASRLDLDADRETEVYSAFHAWWQELAAALDVDGDGVISAEEYAAGSPELPAPALVRLADVLFEVTDTDRSGTISVQEYRKLLHTGFSHELAAAPDADLTKAAFTTEFMHFMAGRRPSLAWERLTTDG